MWPPQILKRILKWHVSPDPLYHLFTDPVFLYRFQIWVFTLWARPATLSILCYSFDQSSFFLLQAVASVCLVTPTEESACMAYVLTHSQVSGPGVTGFLKIFFSKGLKIPPLPENLIWVTIRFLLESVVTCHHKETPTQAKNRKVNIFFQKNWESPNLDNSGKKGLFVLKCSTWSPVFFT